MNQDEMAIMDQTETLWKALVECDESFDSVFRYAVKTVGVFCRPSCKSKTPLKKNVEYFRTAEEALRAGYRPCKRCRPDLVEYNPSLKLAEQVKKLIDANFYDRKALSRKMEDLYLSSNHVNTIFKRHYGCTPIQYMNKVRLLYVQERLLKTSLPISRIAFESGFGSLSAFYKFFKNHMGIAPETYRIEQQAKKAENQKR